MSKNLIPASRPRNPLAVHARQRLAGAHQPSRGALRRQARDALRRELWQTHPPSP